MDTLKKVMEGHFEGVDEATKAATIRDLIQVCSIAAGAVAIQPIPLLDIALISPIQIGLVQGIGRVHGHHLDKKSVVEILSTFGASIVAQNVIMAAAKMIPFLGWVVGPSMAYALTYAVGEVSDHYFRAGRGMPNEDLKSMFDKVYKQKRAEKEAANKGNDTLKQKLEQLKEAYAGGLLTEQEFAAKKEELLKNF
jgi:uncharacterized protein (DUF697 family)